MINLSSEQIELIITSVKNDIQGLTKDLNRYKTFKNKKKFEDDIEFITGLIKNLYGILEVLGLKETDIERFKRLRGLN